MKQLTLIDKAFLLKRTAPFSALDFDLLLTISDKLGLVVFNQGEFIFEINEEANRMYFIVKGEVQIQLSQKILHTLTNNDFFGEEALFNNKVRSYSAYSSLETYILTLSRSNLYAIISECPTVAIGFLQVYTSLFPIRGINDN